VQNCTIALRSTLNSLARRFCNATMTLIATTESSLLPIENGKSMHSRDCNASPHVRRGVGQQRLNVSGSDV
jgi:hypothetical protein